MSDHMYDLDVGVVDKVSIVIPTYKQLPYAKKCIESIIEYTKYPNYEIIVCDDFSEIPALEEYLKHMESEGKIKLFLNSERRLCANTMDAIRTATGQFLCFMNDDVEIPSDSGDWLWVLLNALKMNRGKWASITPAMYHSAENKNVYWVGKTKENFNQPFHDYLHAPFGDPRLPREPVYCCYNTFACCLTWTGLTNFLEVGKNHDCYGVDSDWCYEIEGKLGLTHWMVPDTYIYHANIYMLRG